MLQDKKAVIFDLDGTLVDSMWMWKSIDIEFLSSFQLTCPEDLQREIEGMSFTETAMYFKQRFELPLTVSQIQGTWINMTREKYRTEVPLKDGAKEFLEYLKQKQVKMGIATSNGREIVDVVIEALQIKSYFQVVATGCEVAAGKPSPDIYLEVSSRLKIPPKQCLVFEDLPAGITAGKRANMEVCAIDDHYSRGMYDEKVALADYYIRNYFDVLNGAVYDK